MPGLGPGIHDFARENSPMDAIELGWRRVIAAQLRTRARIDRLAFVLGVKFDPAQPRKPAGQPDGGQWAEVDGPVLAQARRPPNRPAAPRRDRRREQECEEQFNADLVVCRNAASAACYEQALLRRNRCERGLPIPPLNF
jgi:hypothetical protein